ncbi:recombinase RecT, partial [Salmonella enterica]|uniref:recombinase RecT n=1 Tax=Salmonella enterica TaxID=28901 RepID=UPI003CE91A97
EAQFQIGYKGYIQLAIRSGRYKKLNVLAIKEGELIRFDPLNEEIEVRLIEDEELREEAPTIGYYAMFEYTNG